ncbi:MAG: ABC transporter permease, partial [Verrucomicrobiaceae bacterium]
CGAIGLLAAAHVRNINQFQTVYSFLIAPIFYLSGVFFPLGDRPILSVIAQFSPFYHGVRLLQMSGWGVWYPTEVLYHVAALFAFATVLSLWAHASIQKKLTN